MSRHRFALRVWGAALTALLLSSCSTSGNGSAPGLPASGSSQASPAAKPARKLAHVGIKIVIPPRHRRRRKHGGRLSPAYLTPEVQGVSIAVSQPSSPYQGYVFYALGASEPYCSGGTGSQPLSCTLALQAPPGTDLFTVNTYDQPNTASGYIISTATVTQTITAHGVNSINVATSGVVSSLQIALDGPVFATPGVASTSNVLISALDFDGNAIVGDFDQPLVLSEDDPSQSTALSTTSLAGSSDLQGVTLAYNGGTLQSESNCGTGVNVQVEAQSPSDAYNGGPFTASACLRPSDGDTYGSPDLLYFASPSAGGQTVTVTGGSGSPYAISTGTDRDSDPNCNGIVSVTGGGPSFTITPVGSGSCYLSPQDGNGDMGLPIPVSVSP